MNSIFFYIPGLPYHAAEKQSMVWPNIEELFKEVINGKETLNSYLLKSIVAQIKAKTYVHKYSHRESEKWRKWVSRVSRQMSIDEIQVAQNISMKVEYVLIKPKGSKRVFPSSRPSLTSLTKNLEDGMKKIMFKDEGQIIEKLERKTYDDSTGLSPGAYVTLNYLHEDELESYLKKMKVI